MLVFLLGQQPEEDRAREQTQSCRGLKCFPTGGGHNGIFYFFQEEVHILIPGCHSGETEAQSSERSCPSPAEMQVTFPDPPPS